MSIRSCLKLSFCSNYINPDIKFDISLDGYKQTYCFDQQQHEYICEFDDNQESHVFTLTLVNKEKHIDQMEDFLVHITQVELDYVDITKFFCWQQLLYQTNYNDTTFCECMGADGTVTFEFQSPVYQWLKSNYKWYT
jgi:hypothetical protein